MDLLWRAGICRKPESWLGALESSFSATTRLEMAGKGICLGVKVFLGIELAILLLRIF
jgi:hypothetical protein